MPAHLRELPGHGSIEPAIPGLGEENLQRVFGRKSSPVGAVGRERIIDVHDLQNSGLQWNGFSAKAIRIPAAVHSFMMMPYHREDAAKRLERRAHFFSDHRMLPNDFRFFHVQSPGFKKDVVRHGDFSYVM